MNAQSAAAMDEAQIPAHVPADLVRDFDYREMGDEGDILKFWGQVHQYPAIFFTPRCGGHWVLTRFEDVASVLSNFTDFSSHYQSIPKDSAPPGLPPVGLDPPQHMDFKRVLLPYFSPKSIANLEIRAREITLAMLDQFAGRGGCEFVSEFALTMPIGIFMSLVDLPESDRLPLLAVAEGLVRGKNSEIRQQAFQDAVAYLAQKFEERRANPGSDVLSALLRAKVDGGRSLTLQELVNTGAVLLAAGLDTVAAQMGFTMIFLARNSAHRRRLVADPSLIPVALEEMMRRHSTANIARVVAHDLVYKGVEMKAGDMILTPTTAAGIDELRYANPLTVDFDRPDKQSLIFGRGPHHCIGAFLARTELRVFLAEWLKRIPDFSIAPGETPVVRSGSSNTVAYLPLVWDVPPLQTVS